MSVNSPTHHTLHTLHGRGVPMVADRPRGVNTLGVNTLAPETRPNAEKSAKLPYRTPTVAIPPATLALAMNRARAAVEAMPGHLPGAPIIRQPLDIEEAYWAHVWRRLGRPDPGLAEGVKS